MGAREKSPVLEEEGSIFLSLPHWRPLFDDQALRKPPSNTFVLPGNSTGELSHRVPPPPPGLTLFKHEGLGRYKGTTGVDFFQ